MNTFIPRLVMVSGCVLVGACTTEVTVGGSSSGGAAGMGGGDVGRTTRDIAAGSGATCARKADGSLWCWGSNNFGEVGDGTTNSPKPSPVRVIALGMSVVEVAVGQNHACARKADGSVWCWGSNTQGQIGSGTTGEPELSPVPVTALGESVVQLAAGFGHTCARKANGSVWCWGVNNGGQVGDGTTGWPKPLPVQVLDLGTSAEEIVVSNQHTCARKVDGSVWCWGDNVSGALGDGTTDSPKPSPVQVIDLGWTTAEITAGAFHTCARKVDGSVWCWGDNYYGELGDGTMGSPKPSPIQVSALGTSTVAIAAGGDHTCARRADGSVWCWGDNLFGQIGDGATGVATVPIQVSGLGTSVVAIAAGGAHTCTRMADGSVWCWGHNDAGQVGDGTTDSPKLLPVQAALTWQ